MDISAQAMEEVVEMAEDSVVDIDADDAGNPQLVVEYVNDIYSYLRYVLIVVNISLNRFSSSLVSATWRPFSASRPTTLLDRPRSNPR